MLLQWAALASVLGTVWGQAFSSWPHDYPGKPSGDFSPAWQEYFEVTDPLPNVSFPLGRSFAGNIPVNRTGHVNDTLFFWAFEKQNGSLTAENSTEPWGIWLNGGPGSSSLVGLLLENGPLHIASDYSAYANNYNWSSLADYVWVDQPVGVGFSTADIDGYVADEDQMGHDFMNFLANLVKVFPSLKTRPLHLTGESYAGTYIPYITKTYFGLEDPPVNLTKIAIGDGSIGEETEFVVLPTLNVIETYPQIIGYDTEVYEYFKEQTHLCGYDLNLTYPQNGTFPTLYPSYPPQASRTHASPLKKAAFEQAFLRDLRGRRARISKRALEPSEEQLRKREQWKRDLSGRANGTIDPWYGCDLYDEMINYALNFTFPWKGNYAPDFSTIGFDVYDVPDALFPEAPMDASVFLNDNRTRAAIHAPTSKHWQESIRYPFGSVDGAPDPSVKPMAFLTDLATNATERGVHVVIYSGNDDSLVAHRGSEVVIQNTTFGGVQGFSRRPSTPWYGDDGTFAGIVHQERNWTYVLFEGAGHLVPEQQPAHAYVFLREFILGTNNTGLVTTVNGSTVVIGGENATLAAPALPGQLGLYIGAGTTQSTYTFPPGTIAAWNSFISTATATVTLTSTVAVTTTTTGDGSGDGEAGVSTATLTASAIIEPSKPVGGANSGAGRVAGRWLGVLGGVVAAILVCL